MNQVDKELLISKGFMNEQERVNDVEFLYISKNWPVRRIICTSIFMCSDVLEMADSEENWMVFMPPLFTKKFWKDMRCTSLCIFERS